MRHHIRTYSKGEYPNWLTLAVAPSKLSASGPLVGPLYLNSYDEIPQIILICILSFVKYVDCAI